MKEQEKWYIGFVDKMTGSYRFLKGYYNTKEDAETDLFLEYSDNEDAEVISTTPE